MHSNRKYVPAIEVSAGSLGTGLPISGAALAPGTRRRNWRTIAIVGDGELDEAQLGGPHAGAHYKLGNLTVIVDKNQLQMTG